MSVLQLDTPLYVETPLGPASAHFLYDGPDFLWGCFQAATGECWWWRNHDIRLRPSISEGRYAVSPIAKSPEMDAALKRHLRRQGV